MDEKARRTYDRLQQVRYNSPGSFSSVLSTFFLQAKKAALLRNDQLDSKRRKLKSDLEARERNIGVFVDAKQQFANAEEQFKAEIDRLRKEGSRLVEEEQRLMREQIHKNNPVSTNGE